MASLLPTFQVEGKGAGDRPKGRGDSRCHKPKEAGIVGEAPELLGL